MGESAFYGCEALVVYCEAEGRPSGWDSDWNSSNCPVIWGFVGDFIEANNVFAKKSDLPPTVGEWINATQKTSGGTITCTMTAEGSGVYEYFYYITGDYDDGEWTTDSTHVFQSYSGIVTVIDECKNLPAASLNKIVSDENVTVTSRMWLGNVTMTLTVKSPYAIDGYNKTVRDVIFKIRKIRDI
jgi:hypothetical protein